MKQSSADRPPISLLAYSASIAQCFRSPARYTRVTSLQYQPLLSLQYYVCSTQVAVLYMFPSIPCPEMVLSGSPKQPSLLKLFSMTCDPARLQSAALLLSSMSDAIDLSYILACLSLCNVT